MKLKLLKDILNQEIYQLLIFLQKMKDSENEIRFFLKTKMYNNKNVIKKNNEGKLIIKKLFNKIKNNPSIFISKNSIKNDNYRFISDFISGMTDRYAINLYNKIK